MNERKRDNLIKYISIGLVSVIFVFTIILIIQFVSIGILESNKHALDNELSNIENRIIDYTSENEYLRSTQFLEDYAYEILSWGKAGEIIFK